MTPWLSLRGRVLAGAVLWTIGLFIIAGAAMTLVMTAHPRVPGVVHGWFTHPLVMLLALGSMAAGFLQVRIGLSGVSSVRAGLAALHDGRGRRMDGSYPSEIQPLVNDLNALLDDRERAIRRAVAKAGDLAHGLKTPLSLLVQEAGRADAAGHAELAAAIRQQIDRMNRQVDYHLAQARASASSSSPGTRTPVRESVDGLARALQRLHAGDGVTIEINVPDDHAVRAQREDLDEMLGNLLDNACKWARARVSIGSSLAGAGLVITIDDDGDGLAEHMRQTVLQRGVKADEAAPGHGLGLAIVSDLAELYGGSVILEQSPLGGLRARLALPSGAAPISGEPLDATPPAARS